jgi:hypothetical protein
MLLSRSWGAKVKGTFQLYMSYATIPVFGQWRRLYKETLMKYMINIQEKPHNYPLYFAHYDRDSFILYNEGDLDNLMSQLEDDALDMQEDEAIIEVKNTATV